MTLQTRLQGMDVRMEQIPRDVWKREQVNEDECGCRVSLHEGWLREHTGLPIQVTQ